MIVFSSTITSFTTLFFARDLSFLIFSPLSSRAVFLFKSVETSLYSSWMVVLAMVPFLGAFGHVYHLSAGFYVYLAGLTIPFVAIACVIGIAISMTLICFFPSRRVREIMVLLGILAGCTIYVLFRLLEPEKLIRADSYEVILQYIALLEAPLAPYLPSWWMASAVTAFIGHNIKDVWAYGGLLLGVAALMGAGIVFFAEKAYYNGWTSAQEAGRRRKTKEIGTEWRWIPGFFTRPFRGLLGKDSLLFVRDFNQWSQFLLLLALVAVYLISIRKLPLDTPYLQGLISFLNIGMVGFVVAAVALRFVFPAVSLEGSTWWVVRAAPVSLWLVLWEKFLLGFFPLAAMGLVLVWVSNWFLQVDTFVVWLSNITIVVMALCLTGMGIGFGALFPRFHVENVAQIETSAGGVLYMICALFYVGCTLSAEAVLMRMHYFGLIGRVNVWKQEAVVYVISFLLLINLLSFSIPFLLGKRNLERADL